MYIDIGGFTMKEENRKYAELAYDIVKEAENMGSRLNSGYLKDKLMDNGKWSLEYTPLYVSVTTLYELTLKPCFEIIT